MKRLQIVQSNIEPDKNVLWLDKDKDLKSYNGDGWEALNKKEVEDIKDIKEYLKYSMKVNINRDKCIIAEFKGKNVGHIPIFYISSDTLRNIDKIFVSKDFDEIQMIDPSKDVYSMYDVEYKEGCVCVYLPKKELTEISAYSIDSNSHLVSLTIPKGVTTIYNKAFMDCPNLKYIDIPKSVDHICENVFKNSQWLKDQPNGKVYINNVLYAYKGPLEGTNLVLDDNTTCIVRAAFSSCPELESFNIPSQLKYVDGTVFNNTQWYKNLEEGPVYLNNILLNYKGTIEGDYTVEEGIEYISDYAFSRQKCTSIIFPESVKHIGTSCMQLQDNLTYFKFPKAVDYIPMACFYGCTGLTNVELQDHIKVLEYDAFRGCPNLTTVKLPKNLEKIGTQVFLRDTSLKEIILPSKCAYLGYSAFEYCTSLERIIVNKNIEHICLYSFFGCTNLKLVDFSNSTKIPLLESNNVFGNTHKDLKIVVPDNLYDEWIKAPYWEIIKNKIIKVSKYKE